MDAPVNAPNPWADGPPGPGTMRWRLGVLDHDLTNGDLQAPAEEVAGWYVEDVTRLLGLLERLEWTGSLTGQARCPACRGLRLASGRGRHVDGCELAAMLHPDPEQAP